MKTLELNNLPTPVLLVWGLPEGKLQRIHVTEKGNLAFFIYDEMKGSTPMKQKLPEGNWQLIGKMSELTDKEILQGISAKGYYFTNPKGEEPDTRCSAYTDMYTIAKNARMWDEWNEFESKTLPANTLIFKRV